MTAAVQVHGSPDLRARLRRIDDALSACLIGVVPILWNNVDLDDLRLGTDAETILDEIVRTGFEGCQLGLGFPEGRALQDSLRGRGLRLAEVYASLPTTAEGPTDDALVLARERLRLLDTAGGDVLVVALDLSPGRVEAAGRVDSGGPGADGGTGGTPRLTRDGWTRLADVLATLSADAAALGHPIAFHQHAGTYVETPEELERLAELVDPRIMGLCLDVGHYLVGGGDPVAALRRYGQRVTHVHLKDVDPDVLDALRAGGLGGFREAIRARLFTELGAGILDLEAVLGELDRGNYEGWLMVEQDSCWGPPSESAAIGRRVLAVLLHRIGQARVERNAGPAMAMNP